MLLIDESDQVLSYLFEPICNKNGVRPAILKAFEAHLKAAIAGNGMALFMSADNSDIEYEFLKQMALPGCEVRVIVNHYQPPKGKVNFDISNNPDSSIDELVENLKKGIPCFVIDDVKNGVKGCKSIAEYIRKILPNGGDSIVEINSDTSSSEKTQNYLKDINQASSDTLLLICSPSVISGISIENGHFQQGYGFYNGILTPKEASQSLVRVRGLENLTVWAAKKGFTWSNDRSITAEFLQRHQLKELNSTEQIDALRLLEMERHTLLMYTSCGWFFEEISRPEGTQILRYAARALELAGEISGIHLKQEFMSRLAQAPSNVAHFGNGQKVYQDLVIPSQVSLQQVAAHYAISSLFANYRPQERIYCYEVEQLDYQKQQMGTFTLAVGQVRLTSEITWENQHFVFAVLHLGGWDFHCCITSFEGRLAYGELKQQLFNDIKQASAAQVILTMNRLMGDQSFSLHHLFAEERQRIVSLLTRNTKKHLDQLYTQVYRENYSMLAAYQREELPVPQELMVAAEVALSFRSLETVKNLERAIEDPIVMDSCLAELLATATEAKYLKCQLNIPEAKKILEQTILRLLWKLLYDGDPATLVEDVARLESAIAIGEELNLGLSLDRAQEVYHSCLHQRIVPDCLISQDSERNSCRWEIRQIKPLLSLGQKLEIDVSPWLN